MGKQLVPKGQIACTRSGEEMTPLIWAVTAFTAAVLIFWLVSTPQGLEVSESVTGGVRYVVDGDSLYIDGHKPQVRLWGVDAPEQSESGFKAATDYLFLIAQSQKITCQIVDRDRYGRTVARCFLPDGREINRLMIESPHAKEYHHFTKGFYSR